LTYYTNPISFVPPTSSPLSPLSLLPSSLLFQLGVYLVSELWYLAVAGFYYLCWTQDWLLRYRIQKRASMPDDALIKRCLEEVCIRSALGRLPFLFVLFDAFKYMGMEIFVPLPPWPTVLKHWAFALVVNDTLFYWTHRLMHHRLFYKHFHKKHHEFRVRREGGGREGGKGLGYIFSNCPYYFFSIITNHLFINSSRSSSLPSSLPRPFHS
jgi:hypothetical protein